MARTRSDKSADPISVLYERPLPSTRTGALYNAFSYPTKISPEAIAVFIASHTSPGDTVLDAFAGSGTAGLAALLCDRPTDAMKKMAIDMGVKPKWGPRNAHLFEIGTLGSFVAKTMCSPPDPKKFLDAAELLIAKATAALGPLYRARSADGRDGHLRHIVWTEVLACPFCGTETTFWDAAVKRDPLTISSSFVCRSCKKETKTEDCERVTETVRDDFSGKPLVRRKRVLAQIYGQSGSEKWKRAPNDDDHAIFAAATAAPLPPSAPDSEIAWGDLHRTGYHFGITKLHHFYTRRNFLAISTLWEIAGSFPDDVRDALRLLVLSYNSSHSTLMTRVVVKKGQNDLVLTGSQSGVLYISGLPVEKNVLVGIGRKAKSFRDAFAMLRGSRSSVAVHHASSERIDLPDASIDYVFTDPPFGGYIPYAEINQINEIWLGTTTDRSREIIVSHAQNKGVDDYGRMMGAVFGELFRVLRAGGLATVVFHSAHSAVWRALVAAYVGAGFSVKATSILDKIQASFKQVVSGVSVKGDPLLLLTKESSWTPAGDADSIVAEMVSEVARGETDPQRLWSMFVGKCLERGIHVPMEAKEFYGRVRAAAEAAA